MFAKYFEYYTIVLRAPFFVDTLENNDALEMSDNLSYQAAMAVYCVQTQ